MCVRLHMSVCAHYYQGHFTTSSANWTLHTATTHVIQYWSGEPHMNSDGHLAYMYESTVAILKWQIALCSVTWLYLKDGMLDVTVNNVDFVSLDRCVPEAIHMGLQSTLWHEERRGGGTPPHKGCGMLLSSTAKAHASSPETFLYQW